MTLIDSEMNEEQLEEFHASIRPVSSIAGNTNMGSTLNEKALKEFEKGEEPSQIEPVRQIRVEEKEKSVYTKRTSSSRM